jgi:undecaprenyl diphosphate synthase
MQFPQHIGIIPDGNRTRAKDRGLSALDGHSAGQKNSIELLKFLVTTPVRVATFWGLSTENLRQRSSLECAGLFALFDSALSGLDILFGEQKINFRRVGSPVWIPERTLNSFLAFQTKHTYTDPKLTAVFAINYGGRDEIVRGIDRRQQAWSPQLTEENFGQYLDFGDLPVIDLVIRTKSEEAQRVSGFMSRWIGYAELYFSQLTFPDFAPTELQKAIERWSDRADKRNFGK